jgi:hypothetical protein
MGAGAGFLRFAEAFFAAFFGAAFLALFFTVAARVAFLATTLGADFFGAVFFPTFFAEDFFAAVFFTGFLAVDFAILSALSIHLFAASELPDLPRAAVQNLRPTRRPRPERGPAIGTGDCGMGLS